MLTTRYSDDDYPWPAGMTPWLIERGGGEVEYFLMEQGVKLGRICQSPLRTETFSGKIKSQEMSLRHLFVISAIFPLLLPRIPFVPNIKPPRTSQPSQIQSKLVQKGLGLTPKSLWRSLFLKLILSPFRSRTLQMTWRKQRR